MKSIKLLALIVCAAALVAGCATKKCCSAEKTATASCGMKCCADGKTTCATCATCSAKK